MSDYKEVYSDTSRDYISNNVANNEIDKGRYDRSKEREEKFGENWNKQKVNLNEVVDYFVPKATEIVTQYTKSGVKYHFEGTQYIVKCDKAAGYLRVYDKFSKMYCKLDGTPSKNNLETHFKIKTRKEM